MPSSGFDLLTWKKVIEIGQAFQTVNLILTVTHEWVGPRPLDHSELRDKGDSFAILSDAHPQFPSPLPYKSASQYQDSLAYVPSIWFG